MKSRGVNFMEYVKLVAKPGTWYKAGTEVYCWSSMQGEKVRLSRFAYEQAVNSQWSSLSVKGTRVCEDPRNAAFQVKRGEEYQDIRHVKMSDFIVSYTEERLIN
jgi:hypothetical protein